jgi:hypothetical protein
MHLKPRFGGAFFASEIWASQRLASGLASRAERAAQRGFLQFFLSTDEENARAAGNFRRTEMFNKLGMAAALLSTITVASAAWADVIHFNLPNTPLFSTHVQDNFAFHAGAGNGFGNWIAFGLPQFNADDTANIFQTVPQVTEITSRGGGDIFNFTSIGLASQTNDHWWPGCVRVHSSRWQQ